MNIRITPHTVIYLTVLAAALILGVWSARMAEEPTRPELSPTVQMVSPPLAAPEFNLIDFNQQAFTRKQLEGHWSLVFFGYTYCPDVCPNTMMLMNQAMQRLEESGSPLKPTIYFVSLDPDRDTPEQLKNYISYFNPAFIGITGEDEALEALAEKLNIFHSFVMNLANPDNYLMEHSAEVLLISPRTEVIARFAPPHTPSIIAENFQKLAQFYQETRE